MSDLREKAQALVDAWTLENWINDPSLFTERIKGLRTALAAETVCVPRNPVAGNPVGTDTEMVRDVGIIVPCHCHDARSKELCLDKHRCTPVLAAARPQERS